MNRVLDEVVESALRELADESEQRELWRAAAGPRVSSFTECMSRLWDDSGLGDALDGTDEVYSPLIDRRFRMLGLVLDRIDGLRAPDEILADPRLQEARVLARQLLIDLRRFGEDAE